MGRPFPPPETDMDPRVIRQGMSLAFLTLLIYGVGALVGVGAGIVLHWWWMTWPLSSDAADLIIMLLVMAVGFIVGVGLDIEAAFYDVVNDLS